MMRSVAVFHGVQSCMSRSPPNIHLDGSPAVIFAFLFYSMNETTYIDYDEYNQFTSTVLLNDDFDLSTREKMERYWAVQMQEKKRR